jgi:ribonucleotide monophosphatase NagD (HAD superfamily)
LLDIAGANAMEWSSILVRTGIYDPEDSPPAHKPTHEVENVEEGVLWALERELGGVVEDNLGSRPPTD